MITIGLQRGHYKTRSSQTGAAGEVEANIEVSLQVENLLRPYNAEVKLVLLDSPLGGVTQHFNLFLSLHCDGSVDHKASGFGLSYPNSVTPVFAGTLTNKYAVITGLRFKGYNYTKNMSKYYGFRQIKADVKVLLEMGFVSNPDDKKVIYTRASRAIVAAIVKHYNLDKKPELTEKVLRIKFPNGKVLTNQDGLFLKNGVMYGPVRAVLLHMTNALHVIDDNNIIEIIIL